MMRMGNEGWWVGLTGPRSGRRRGEVAGRGETWASSSSSSLPSSWLVPGGAKEQFTKLMWFWMIITLTTWWWPWGAVLWHIRCSPRPTGGRSGPEPGDQDDDKERGCTVQSSVETLLWILQIYWSQDDELWWISTSPSGQHWIMVYVLSSLHFGSKIMHMMYDITKMRKISNEWCMDLKKKKLW